MKQLLLLFIICSTSIASAHEIKVYYEQVENGYDIYADNSELCPVSVKIKFNLTNLTLGGTDNTIYTIDALKKKQLLTTLRVTKKGKAYKFSYNTLTNLGPNKETYDKDYAYDLPYKTASTFKVTQGYNGQISHKNQNALDFKMPVGTDVMAIRDGIVIKVIEKNSKNCAKEVCKKYNNKIIIYHPDGTFAEYTHIKKNGSIVKVGDTVKQGQHIAYSGNVGWSTGPHLHLVVFLQKLNKRETVATKFKTGDGKTLERLIEKIEYTKNY